MGEGSQAGAATYNSEMVLAARVENFHTRRRDWGLKRALHWQVMSLLFKLGIRVHYVFLEPNLGEIFGEEKPVVPEGFDTRIVGLETMLPVAGIVPDLDREFLETVFARGDLCVANFRGEEVVGFAFFSFTRARMTPQLDVLVPKGFIYGYKGWTHPDYRRSNLTSSRVYVRHRWMRQHHSLRGINYIETHNYASLLRSYRAPHHRRIKMGLCGWFTLFGRQIPFNSRRAKWLGFEMVRKEDHRPRNYTV